MTHQHGKSLLKSVHALEGRAVAVTGLLRGTWRMAAKGHAGIVRGNRNYALERCGRWSCGGGPRSAAGKTARITVRSLAVSREMSDQRKSVYVPSARECGRVPVCASLAAMATATRCPRTRTEVS